MQLHFASTTPYRAISYERARIGSFVTVRQCGRHSFPKLHAVARGRCGAHVPDCDVSVGIADANDAFSRCNSTLSSQEIICNTRITSPLAFHSSCTKLLRDLISPQEKQIFSMKRSNLCPHPSSITVSSLSIRLQLTQNCMQLTATVSQTSPACDLFDGRRIACATLSRLFAMRPTV